jgi:hypothetical protein
MNLRYIWFFISNKLNHYYSTLSTKLAPKRNLFTSAVGTVSRRSSHKIPLLDENKWFKKRALLTSMTCLHQVPAGNGGILDKSLDANSTLSADITPQLNTLHYSRLHYIALRLTFNVNFLPQISKRSSRLGPSSSITRALYFPHGPAVQWKKTHFVHWNGSKALAAWMCLTQARKWCRHSPK